MLAEMFPKVGDLTHRLIETTVVMVVVSVTEEVSSEGLRADVQAVWFIMTVIINQDEKV